jgi:carbonic anhydrase/acetyltransferase-like protein (isoleucine patch superfamily)
VYLVEDAGDILGDVDVEDHVLVDLGMLCRRADADEVASGREIAIGSHLHLHGSYSKCCDKFKEFSRTFQGVFIKSQGVISNANVQIIDIAN